MYWRRVRVTRSRASCAMVQRATSRRGEVVSQRSVVLAASWPTVTPPPTAPSTPSPLAATSIHVLIRTTRHRRTSPSWSSRVGPYTGRSQSVDVTAHRRRRGTGQLQNSDAHHAKGNASECQMPRSGVEMFSVDEQS